MTSSLVQPSTEKAMAYSKHVYDIVTAVQADLTKLGEAHLAEGQKHMHDAIDQMVKKRTSWL